MFASKKVTLRERERHTNRSVKLSVLLCLMGGGGTYPGRREGVTCPGWGGVLTLTGDTYLDQGDWYLPWTGGEGTYFGQGEGGGAYPSWGREGPTLAGGGYLPWWGYIPGRYPQSA